MDVEGYSIWSEYSSTYCWQQFASGFDSTPDALDAPVRSRGTSPPTTAQPADICHTPLPPKGHHPVICGPELEERRDRIGLTTSIFPFEEEKGARDRLLPWSLFAIVQAPRNRWTLPDPFPAFSMSIPSSIATVTRPYSGSVFFDLEHDCTVRGI